MQPAVNFDISRYLNQAFEFYKTHWEKVLVGSFCLFLMSLIPFCQLLALGNYFKFLRRLDAGQNPAYGEIFSFDNAAPYLKSYLFLFLALIVLELPLLLTLPFLENGEKPQGAVAFLLVPYMFILMMALFYISVRLYYYIGILAFRNEQDLKKAWKESFAMTQGNFWQILLFSLLLGLIAQLGFLACCIGIFLTIPFQYVGQYFSYKSALFTDENPAIASEKINYF